MPNLALDDVPVGKDEKANKLIEKFGNIKKFSFKPKSHDQIGLKNNEIDFDTSIKLSGSRFVILKNNLEPLSKEPYNKASLKFILDHQRGSLAAVLNVLSDCLLNLTKIQSLPVIKTPGKYAFFVDVKFEKTDFFQKAVSILKIMALEFKVIGQYLEYKK